MIGYWIVMALVSCAVTAVIVATATSGAATTSPAPRRREDQGPIVIAALGASDATGEGTQNPEEESWLAQLAVQLPPHTELRNFGVGGSWLAAAYEHQVPHAAAIEPDIVIGWLIVNDLTQGETLERYLDALDLTLAALARPGRPILLGNAPQLWCLPAFNGSPDDIVELRLEVERWNLGLVEVASRYDARIVDLSVDPVALEDLCDDGFHPSTAGHAKLAATFQPHVLRAIDLVRAARS